MREVWKFARGREPRRINMVDGECVGAPGGKPSSLWLSSATTPVCVLQRILRIIFEEISL